MSLLKDVVHGTIDFVLGTSLEAVVGFLAGAATRSVVTRIPRPEGSRFLSRRAPLALSRRAVHVPKEAALAPLEDAPEAQRDVEYVVQEHLAKRAGRHFDLRLVLKGRSVSWAIPMKGKRARLDRMPQPGERWAAIRQPDHLREYNRFEGVIPDGEKGAGIVRRWAMGTADVHKIEDGHVHFRIFSGPAKGSYTIVRTKGNQGLIVPKKAEAVDGWSKPAYTKREAALLAALEDGQHVAERKVDGAAVELRLEEGRARVFSHRTSRRTGTLIEHSDRLPHVADLPGARGLDGTRLRAEAWHPRGVNFLSGTLNSNVDRARQLQRSAGPVRLDVFDIVKFKGKDVRSLPYGERRALYVEAVNRLRSPHVQPVRQARSGFERFYDQQVSLKGAPTDGIVLKRLDAAHPGSDWDGQTGSAHAAPPWVKVKPSDLADLEVVGFKEGRGEDAGSLGALTAQGADGRNVQVGSGFTDWERNWIWRHRDEVLGDTARVEFHVRGGEITRTGPRFDSWHPDKSEVALRMYADAMDVSPYALKSAAGWRSAA